MRTVMPALQKAKSTLLAENGLQYVSASLPSQQRQTRVVKDMAGDAIAQELVEWIGAK
jgi:electron transfer flavoprotein beta subunit